MHLQEESFAINYLENLKEMLTMTVITLVRGNGHESSWIGTAVSLLCIELEGAAPGS